MRRKRRARMACVSSRSYWAIPAYRLLRSTLTYRRSACGQSTIRPIPHVIRTTSPNYPVGHQDRFSVLAEDQNRYFTMKATIVAKTAHLYIYVQNGVKVNQSTTQAAADYFEKSIYPTDRASFGSE